MSSDGELELDDYYSDQADDDNIISRYSPEEWIGAADDADQESADDTDDELIDDDGEVIVRPIKSKQKKMNDNGDSESEAETEDEDGDAPPPDALLDDEAEVASPADVQENQATEELSKWSQEIVVVKPENRRTSNRLSLYEMTEIVGILASYVEKNGAQFMPAGDADNSITIAKRTLMHRKCPLVLRRVVGRRKNPATKKIELYCEYWDPNEMIFSVTYDDVM